MSGPTQSPSITPIPPSTPPGVVLKASAGNSKPIAGEDCLSEERSSSKRFSFSILKEKIDEYQAGKYTEKYIRTYLDFVHLEGIIDNLQYLEVKKYLDLVK